ncbi:MAG: C40 family peptidase, partial [Oscillospiraceae bacterium]|nr:C40 family peptidase [Oscillospiraceae bacterium]
AVNTTKTSITHSSAKAGTTYYYKVRAFHTNSSANGAYSPAVTVTCKLATPQISAALNSSGKPVVSWKAVSGAVKYQVYRATGTNGSYSLLTTTTDTTITNTKLEANKTYCYKVRAVAQNTAANSSYSNVLSVSTGPSATQFFVDRYLYSPYAILYDKPDTESTSVMVKYREKLGVGADFATYDHGRWATVLYNGKVYYNWIATGVERFTDEEAFNYINSSNSQIQNDVLELALKYTQLPTSYRHDESQGVLNEIGTYGFDCSGFAGYVLNTIMSQHNPLYTVTKNITGLYETQTIYNNGFANQFDVQDIEVKDMKPGDIIFFDVYDDAREVDHCGIYLGNNEFVHSTSFHDGVLISPLRDDYLENFRGVRRYFPYTFKPADQRLATKTDKTDADFRNNVYIYAERDDSSEHIYTFTPGEQVTLLYTSSNGNWGYVRLDDGTEGYVLMKRFDLVG